MLFKIYAITNEYMDYLRSIDDRVPRQDYFKEEKDIITGEIKRIRLFKPFIGIVFVSEDGHKYCTQISSKKPRHDLCSEDIDFKKIYLYNRFTSKYELACVVNFNYMFPVPDSALIEVKACNIEHFRDFKSVQEKSKYWSLLKKELAAINACSWDADIRKVYLRENPTVAKRSFDFEKLEVACDNWNKMNSK